jgi:hypothetical protein
MGDARLAVNPDTTLKNKRLRRGGALSLTDKANLCLFALLLVHIGFFRLLVVTRQYAGAAILKRAFARSGCADGR